VLQQVPPQDVHFYDSARARLHFTARFGGVHAFGYDPAKSELIWMKSGTLKVHHRGLALADCGCDPRSSDSWSGEPGKKFFLSGKQTYDFIDFPSAKFHKILTQHVSWSHDENFWNRVLKILP